jgi:hypothetical protein
VNRIVEVVSKGKDVNEGVGGWSELSHKLSEQAGPIIDWLGSNFPFN